ncbi:MAG: helix-turn-helix transcriptional regulator [Clostridia bacterium]|nr:helix-turn-helix transcriptional regulator [Clostridia bacterium]
MLSVFDGRYRDLTNFTSSEYLHINSCGVSYMRFADKPRTTRFYRPDGRVDYHFLLITDGSLSALVDGEEYVLSVGDALFYRSGDTQSYTVTVDEAQPFEKHIYVHFCGSVADEVLQKAGLVNSCVIFSAPSDTRRIFEAVLRSHRAGEEITACGNLLKLVSLLSPNVTRAQSDTVKLIFAEAEYISLHYKDEIDLNECAVRCGLSRSRFSHLFTETVGTSPLQFQQKLRMEQACELLKFTGLTVGEISESVGLSDALYFSRLFKKYTGVSPSVYRKK